MCLEPTPLSNHQLVPFSRFQHCQCCRHHLIIIIKKKNIMEVLHILSKMMPLHAHLTHNSTPLEILGNDEQELFRVVRVKGLMPSHAPSHKRSSVTTSKLSVLHPGCPPRVCMNKQYRQWQFGHLC